MVEYNPMERAFLEFLLKEEQLYLHQLSVLDKVKNKHVFSMVDLKPYKEMLNILSSQNLKTSPFRTAFVLTQVARLVHTFLLDLKQLLREYSFNHKEEIFGEIERLLQRAKEILDEYYETYNGLPYLRFYERWYDRERQEYLPYYNYEYYYEQLYPPKEMNERLEDKIFRELTSKDDMYDSVQFVPKVFGGTNGEYQQYLALQAYKELLKLQHKPTALEDESRLPLSERMLNRIRKGSDYE